MLDPTRKIPDIQRQRRSQVRQSEGHNHGKIKSRTCQVGNAQTGKQLQHRSPPSLEPHIRFPRSGLGNGGGAPRECGFRDQQGVTAGIPQDWGRLKLYPWRVHTRSVHTRAQGKSRDLTGASGGIRGSPVEATRSRAHCRNRLWRQQFWRLVIGVSPAGDQSFLTKT